MAIAVISLGGKQFTVEPGKIIAVPHLNQPVEDRLTLTDLLTGQPVTAEIVDQTRGKKIRVVKFKNKTRSLRQRGYRSLITKVKITKIGK